MSNSGLLSPADLLVGPAADRVGVHPETLRRAIRAGKVSASPDPDQPRLLRVDVASLDAWNTSRVHSTTQYASLSDAARRIAEGAPRLTEDQKTELRRILAGVTDVVAGGAA